MYHVELRQFPHNFCRFNLTERELRHTILDVWLRGEWVELGERRWNPQQAKLTVLEGPRLPVEQLSMGRGWRNAKREGQDVTERLLPGAGVAEAPAKEYWKRIVGPGAADSATPWSATERTTDPDPAVDESTEEDARLVGDSLGLEVLAKLGTESAELRFAWQLARERYPESSASDCLRLAEVAVRSLIEAGLAIVLVANDAGEYEPRETAEQLELTLRAIDSWSSTEGSTPVRLHKA
jgi:hypothetical protein